LIEQSPSHQQNMSVFSNRRNSNWASSESKKWILQTLGLTMPETWTLGEAEAT